MQNQLSQKEKLFLQDLKGEEELCVAKYKAYAQQAQDSQLSQLFSKLANEEHKHYDTINQMLQGNMQSSSQNQSAQSGQSGSQMNTKGLQSAFGGGPMSDYNGPAQQAGQALNASQAQNAAQSQKSGQAQNAGQSSSDKTLLHDMLSTEKYVSSSYDKSIFESAQPMVRQALQNIQKDEQGHGEQIFQYMNSHGMYQVQ